MPPLTGEGLVMVATAVRSGMVEKDRDDEIEGGSSVRGGEDGDRDGGRANSDTGADSHLFINPIYRHVSNFQDRTRDTVKADTSEPVKLDAAAQAHIEKHRKLQDNLTDEMVGLARQLKESSLVMSQSLQNTEKERFPHTVAGHTHVTLIIV
ncbi:hypothetical protein EZV62_027052 [Acer yangbiense]|uniref:Uncharacterized protein n=1 Tax=Acer yangbiense TaxID=1000413 RepID=A0A5C7GSR3_9ROSI|nr:hypothetical protein EZV62_027052 [Acer yangbiense]